MKIELIILLAWYQRTTSSSYGSMLLYNYENIGRNVSSVFFFT